MASKTGAYAAVLAGAIFVYSAFEHKRVIDVLLMRPSTLPNTNGTATTTQDGSTNAGSNEDTAYDPNTYSGGLRDAVCLAAQKAVQEPQGSYSYDEVRPYPASLYPPPSPVVTDCSGFVTLCYKAAGATDPNGLGYSGQGYTGSLIIRGKATTTPNPGDLVFWGTPDHVAIYTGDGGIIGFGSDPGPIESTVQEENGYHQRFLGYRSYLALTNNPTSGVLT